MFAAFPSKVSSGTALVVDSTPLLSRLYAAMLSAAGYRVLSASNDREALAILTLEKPDIIVLDGDPPALSAPRLLEGLRSDARLSDVGVLLLTDADGAFAAGANDYLCKPVDRAALVSRVRAVIESQNAGKKLRSLRDVAAERDGHLREVKEHRQVQASLLPQGAVTWGAWRCVGALRASATLGGNLFDIVVEPDGERTIVLVSAGRGIVAAKVARRVLERLHTSLPGRDLRRVAAELCADCRDAPGAVRLALVRTGKAKVDVFNAGLPPLAVCRARYVQDARRERPPLRRTWTRHALGSRDDSLVIRVERHAPQRRGDGPLRPVGRHAWGVRQAPCERALPMPRLVLGDEPRGDVRRTTKRRGRRDRRGARGRLSLDSAPAKSAVMIFDQVR